MKKLPVKELPTLKENFLYVSFHKPRGIIGAAISLWTLGKYAHAEFVYNGMVYYSNPGGVNKKPWVHDDNMEYYELSARIDIDKVMEFFEMTVGQPYDMKGIVQSQFLFMYSGHNLDEFFCSEWVLNAIDFALDNTLKYKDKSIADKGYNKFNPTRLYKYLLEQELLENRTIIK